MPCADSSSKSKAFPERIDGENSHREVEVGDGVQGYASRINSQRLLYSTWLLLRCHILMRAGYLVSVDSYMNLQVSARLEVLSLLLAISLTSFV